MATNVSGAFRPLQLDNQYNCIESSGCLATAMKVAGYSTAVFTLLVAPFPLNLVGAAVISLFTYLASGCGGSGARLPRPPTQVNAGNWAWRWPTNWMPSFPSFGMDGGGRAPVGGGGQRDGGRAQVGGGRGGAPAGGLGRTPDGYGTPPPQPPRDDRAPVGRGGGGRGDGERARVGR